MRIKKPRVARLDRVRITRGAEDPGLGGNLIRHMPRPCDPT